MATRNSDINLIVRAKTEGERAISSMADAIAHLVNGAGSGNQELAEFGRTVAALDKAAAGLATAQDKVGTSATKQAAAIHEASAGISEQQSRVETLRRGISILSDELKTALGPRKDELSPLLKLAKAELTDAERQLGRYTSAYERNLSALQTSRSSLLGLAQTTRDTAEAQATAAAAVELTTQALSRQTAEAQRAAAAQSFFNAKGGPSGSSATANGATTEALLQHFQRLEAEASKVRAAIDPVGAAIERYEARIKDVQAAGLNGIIGSDEAIIRERQLRFELTQTIDTIAQGAARIREERRNSVTEYQALINELNGVTGKRATESGATFEALDADMRAREAAVRAREADQTRAAANSAGGVGRLAATDTANGTNRATFSALDAREAEKEAQEIREAAFAYQQFEAHVRDGAQALRDAETAAEQEQATIQRLKDKLDPAAAVQRRFNDELEQYRTLARAGKISTDDLAAAERHLAGEAKQATDALKRQGGAGNNFKASLFGLKPYELQNLSYQINDVVTGLASGQRLGQVVAQQGGQILQLFPRAGGAIVGALTNPAIIAFVATIGLIGLGIKRAADDAERLRGATADLGRRANGGNYNAGNVSSQQRELEQLGHSAEDARKALGTFVDAGVPSGSLEQFGRTAHNLSEVLGVDLPTAAQQLTTAFTGGYQAIAELDNRLNFLNSTQRDHIRQLFEDGRAQEAQTAALTIFSQKMGTAADNARGPWQQAFRDLNRSFGDLLDRLSASNVIVGLTAVFNDLTLAITGVKRALDAVSGADVNSVGLGAARSNVRSLQGLLNPQVRQQQGLPALTDASKAQLEEALRQSQAEVDRLTPLAAREQGVPVPQAAGATGTASNRPTTTGDTPLARERRDRLLAISDEERLQQLRDAGQQRLLTAVEKTERARLAGAVAARGEQDAELAAARRRQAAEHEVATVSRETTARNSAARAAERQALQERNQTIQRYLERVGTAEGGAGPNRAGSSALGIGQFTRGTFISVYRQAVPSDTRSDDQIADLRRNPQIATQVLDLFTRQNAQFLTGLRAEITGANLYLIHFLGQGTGRAALRAPGDTPIDQIINRSDPHPAQVLAQNRGYLFDSRAGRYRTRAELQTFLGNRVGDATGTDPNGSAASNVRLLELSAQAALNATRKQDELNLSIQHGNEDRQRTVDALNAQEGHAGIELLDIQKVQAGNQAVEELRQHVEDINRQQQENGGALIEVTPEQIASVRGLAQAVFDVQHARERFQAQQENVTRPIESLQAQLDLLRQQAEVLRSSGDDAGARQIDERIAGINDQLREASQRAVEFFQAIQPGSAEAAFAGISGTIEEQRRQLDLLIARYEHLRDTAQEMPRVLGVSGRTFLDAFSGAAANAFENFIKNVAAGKNVFKSFAQGVKEFVASFALSLAEAILKTLAFLAALEVLSAITHIPVPVLAQIASVGTSVASHHTGGIAGQGSGQRRTVDPAIFATAMRFHTGGIVGLAPDEQPAILRKGEEVLTEGDPRHRNNGGLSVEREATPAPFTIINTFDREQAAEMLLRTRAGERAILNFISDNPSAVKAALG